MTGGADVVSKQIVQKALDQVGGATGATVVTDQSHQSTRDADSGGEGKGNEDEEQGDLDERGGHNLRAPSAHRRSGSDKGGTSLYHEGHKRRGVGHEDGDSEKPFNELNL